MNTQLPYYRKALNDKLVERIAKNPKYSLRAFAKSLGLVSGSLSQILNGKRFLSEDLATALLDKLDLSHEERELFLTSLVKARSKAGLKRMNAAQKSRLKAQDFPSHNRELTADLFKTVSDWYHAAILELTRVNGFNNDSKWISKRLGISEAEVTGAINRLKMLELLEEKEGALVNTSFHLQTANRDISTAALRRRQKQIIEKSLHSLEHHPIQIRNHSARTVAIDPEMIPEAKKRIEAFMLELCDELASRSKEQVYELSVQLFPLEQNPAQKE
jgi:uncharacterized protein (TIGR02147 family)